MPEKISIVKDGGESISSNIVSVFMIPDLSKKYLITTENAVDPHGLTVLHVSEITGDSLVKVATDEEWSTIKTVMRAIISGSVGNYQYIPSFETINAAGQYSRDISVSAPASKQMIDSYANGEKVEPVMEEADEVLDNTVDSDSIFPTAPVVHSEDEEVAPGIAVEEPVTIENTPDAPEVDPSVQGAKPLDPASLPVQEPVPAAPVAEATPAPEPTVTAPEPVPIPAPQPPATPAPIIEETPAPEAPAPAPAEAPVPAPAEAPAQTAAPAPEPATPAPIIVDEPAPAAEEPKSEEVLGAEMVPTATPAVDATTPVAEVVEQPIPTPDSIVANVDAVSPMPESIMDEPVAVPATQNGAAIAVPADPNAVEVNSAPANESVAPEIDALAAAPTVVDAAPAVEPVVKADAPQVLDNTTANVTEGVVDVLAPAGDDAVVTIPPAEPAPEAAPAEATATPAPAEAVPAPEVPEIPVVGQVGTPVAQPVQAQQPQTVVVNQNTVMPQTSAMKNLGITLDFGVQPNMDANATLDEIVAGAQELFIEGTRNLVLVMTDKLYKDLREREENLKKREIVVQQREQAINDSTMAMMNNGSYPQQQMMNQQMMGMQQPMMGQPMMGMQQPMMGQQMMGMQQPMMGMQQPMMNGMAGQPMVNQPVDPNAAGTQTGGQV